MSLASMNRSLKTTRSFGHQIYTSLALLLGILLPAGCSTSTQQMNSWKLGIVRSSLGSLAETLVTRRRDQETDDRWKRTADVGEVIVTGETVFHLDYLLASL